MRTVISDAPPPRRLHWQAALTYSPYQSLSPVIWQHRFVSEMPMTSWSCGAKLRLTEFGANTARGRRRRAVSKTITYSRCALAQGELRCEDHGAIVIKVAGKDYAVNGLAAARYQPIQRIWNSATYPEADIERIIVRGLTLCDW